MPRKLYTKGRFEWEKIIRRVEVPPSRRAVKAVALMAATYADADGTRVFPGVARLALECQMSDRTVRYALEWLRENGLLYRHDRGNQHTGSARYQLCAPENWEQVLPLLPEPRAEAKPDDSDPWR